MKSRALASIALGAAVILGATGCSMLAPQSTTIQYSPADGMNVESSGPLDVRNVFVVANPRGTVGNLVAAIVNPTVEDHTLTIEVGDGPGASRVIVEVPARETVSLGATEEALRLEGLNTAPGATVPMYFQSGDAEGTRVAIPVLDGQLDYLRDLAPIVPGEAVLPTPAHTTGSDEHGAEEESGGH